MAEPQAPVSVPELRQHIAKELRRGKSQDDMVRYLGTRGWPAVTARPFVANAAKFTESVEPGKPAAKMRPAPDKTSDTSDPSNTSIADVYKHRMIRGLLWIVAGIGLSFVTYDIARYARGTGYVFIFAILFGIVDFVLGLRGWLQHRK